MQQLVGNNEKDVVVQKQIRKTEAYNLDDNDGSLSTMHWGHYVRQKIRIYFHKYEKNIALKPRVFHL